MVQLYRWFRERMNAFESVIAKEDSHTVRREITVQTEQRTVLLRSANLQDATLCPLCGQALPGPTEPKSTNQDEKYIPPRRLR